MRRFLVVLCLISVPAFAAKAPMPQMDVLAHVPKDPLLVWVYDDETLGAGYDAIMAQIERFVPAEDREEFQKALNEADAELGVSVRNDLLNRIGPEMAVVLDLPPLDSLMGLAMNPSPEMIDQSLRGVGLIAQVREPQALERALQTALASMELSPVALDGGGWKVPMPTEVGLEQGGDNAPQPALYWQISGNWLTLGAGPSWLSSSARALPEDARLSAGTDFRRVMSHLGGDAYSLFYLNLPKLAQLVSGSAMVQGALSGEPEMQKVVSWLVDEELTVGAAQVAVKVDGGVRSTSFGPEILSGLFTSGIIAALVVPNFVEALEQARVKRTRADLQTAGQALMDHWSEHDALPTSEGWVDLSEVAEQVGGDIPVEDGWKSSLRYWSNGERYVIVSPGKNGEVDRDWSQPVDEDTDTSGTDDVVHSDGFFLAEGPGT